MSYYKISLKAQNLPGGGLFRTLNPYATLTPDDDEDQELGRTEYAFNTRSPDWVKVFYIDANPGSGPYLSLIHI